MKNSRFLILMLTFFCSFSFADTAYIPPTTPQAAIVNYNNGTPVSYNLTKGGYNFEKGTLNPAKASQHFGGVKTQNGNVTATKTHPATFTDSHGAKATGTVNTQTNVGKMSNLSKGFATYAGLNIAGAVVNSPHAQQAAQSLGQGDYGKAAVHAAAAFDFTGLGSGAYGLFDIFQNAKSGKGMQQAVQSAAAQKAQAAAQAAMAQQGFNEQARQAAVHQAQANGGFLYSLVQAGFNVPEKHLGVFQPKMGESAMFSYYTNTYQDPSGGKSWNKGEFHVQTHGPKDMIKYAPAYSESPWVRVSWKRLSAQEIANLPLIVSNAPTLEDLLLNQQELTAIIADYLAKNLAQNQELTAAITDMMWQLGAGNGGLGAENTQTVVTGSPTDNTFVTSPYTPAGSNQAQQTQFIVNQDGSVTASTIPRPDLNAHTSQAPTRHQVGQNTSATQSQTETPKSQSTASAPDICAMNPNSLMCSPLGNMDYEDIKLPTNTIDISLNPLNIFQTTGACPPPEELNLLGNRFSFSYQPMCDGALKLRPWLIFLAMILSFLIVKDAIERQ